MKLFRYLFLCLLISSGCSQKGRESEELIKQINILKKENQNLRDKEKKLEASVSSYERTLAEVEFNLRKIESNLTMMGELSKEVSRDEPIDERVKNRVEIVQRLINNSALKVHMMDYNLNELRRVSSEQSAEILKLDQSVKSSTRELIEKTKQFESQRQLMELSQGELEELYANQKKQVDELSKILNRAYLYSGTAKELKEDKIIDKEGGFIGIGRVKILNANSPEGMFTRLEKDKTSRRTFRSKKIRLLTKHPENSYSIHSLDVETTLTILNEKAFWQHGNYLVVQKF